MNYFNTIQRIVKMEEEVYRDISAAGRTFRYGSMHILVLGLLYGFFSLYFNQVLLKDITNPLVVSVTLFSIIISGVLVVFLAHIGAALIMWLFSRGLGSRVRFSLIYLNLGIALVPLWLSVPGIVAISSGMGGYLLFGYTALTVGYALPLFFMAAKSANGLSALKMFGVMAIGIIYIVSFLYLWV